MSVTTAGQQVRLPVLRMKRATRTWKPHIALGSPGQAQMGFEVACCTVYSHVRVSGVSQTERGVQASVT